LFEAQAVEGWKRHRSTIVELGVSGTKAPPSLFPDVEYLATMTGDRLDYCSATSTPASVCRGAPTVLLPPLRQLNSAGRGSHLLRHKVFDEITR
jgi:hypothetical protein